MLENNLTAVFSGIDQGGLTMARLNALLHLTFDHVSGGALDEPDMETVSLSLLMARQELDVLQANNRKLHEDYTGLWLEIQNLCRDQDRREPAPPAPIIIDQPRQITSKSETQKMQKVA